MGHYAKVKKGKVVKVITADSSFFNNFVDSSPGKWIKTSYNTRGGLHYQANSNVTSSIIWQDASGSVYNTKALADASGSAPIVKVEQGKTLALRGNYAGVGYEYDSTLDAFFAPQPFNSWTKNTSSYAYEAPVPYPTGDATGSYTGIYVWDEAVYNADSGDPKTEGWVTSSLA